MKELFLEKRKCECCGGEELEHVYSDKEYIRTHNETYLFRHHVVICRSCGFCFNSPSYRKKDLENYYADCFSIDKLMPLSYSIDARIDLLKNYTFKEAIFVEIGGNQSSKFHKKLLKYVSSIQSVELNNESLPDLKTMDRLTGASVDILACYGVLEHLPSIEEFFQSSYRVLKNGGIMMIEVPDVKYYSRNLMISSVVHINHFSVHILERIASKNGFKLMEIRRATSSRPLTDFLAVLKKENNFTENPVENPAEYLDTLSNIKDGIAQINKLQNYILSLREKITRLSKENKKITLWCISSFLHKLIDNFELPANVIVVDSDIRKKNYFNERKIPVFMPVDCLEHINDSELIVILSPRNKEDILGWIRKNFGESFNPEKLEVVGDGQYGETYNNT